MAKWTVTIDGDGPGFNSGNPRDVDRLTSRFIKTLSDAGHASVTATCHVGAELNPVIASEDGFDAGLAPLTPGV